MALFTKEINGVIITENDEPVKVELNLVECMRGKTKSKRPQKISHNQKNSANEKTFDFRTKELIMKDRERRDKLKAMNKQISENKKKRFERAKLKKQEKKEREKNNELKGAQVQVIKDTKKIHKWSKKAKERLIKMPKEMFEEYLKTTKVLK